MVEIWKDIPGYEGLYQVSNKGNVRSLNWRNLGLIRNLYLKPHNKGYRQVEFTKDGRKKRFTVHRLVAITFIPNPNNYDTINHIDEDKTNNAVENLEWCTRSYNVRYSLGLHPNKHRKYTRRNITGKQVRRTENVVQLSMLGDVVRVWDNLVSIKHQTGWSDWSIAECCRGNRKSAYGYIWRFAS